MYNLTQILSQISLSNVKIQHNIVHKVVDNCASRIRESWESAQVSRMSFGNRCLYESKGEKAMRSNVHLNHVDHMKTLEP